MKIDRIVILLMSLLFMVACAEQEDDFLSNPQDDGKLRLYITYPEGELFNSTRAGTGFPKDPINDDNPDNRVSSMRVMAFRMGEGGKKRMDKTLTVDKTNTNPSVPIDVPEGEYAFVVVCNQNADPELAAKLDAVDNYQSLRAVQVKGDAFGNGKDIIMVGDSSENLVDTDNDGYGDAPRGLITINEAGLTTAPFNKFTVRVTRLASRLRFTVYTKQHNVAAGEKKVPELTKLEVTHLPGTMGVKGSNHAYDPTTTIGLDGGIVSVPDITTDEVGKGYVTKQTIGRMIIPSSVTFSRENGAMVRAHFGAEGTEGAVVLEGVISYKPDGGGPQMYLLNPNAQYHITLAASPDNLKVAAEVEDWTVENLVGNVGKTYELDSDLKEVYIPYYRGEIYSTEYTQINAQTILPVKVKFLIKSPPYSFNLVNDELGISQRITMTSDEDVINVNIDVTTLMNTKNEYNDENVQFWGFKIPENKDQGKMYFSNYSKVKNFTFRLEDISAGGGAIHLPSVDYLPECVLSRDIYFICCRGYMGSVLWTSFVNLHSDNGDAEGRFPLVESPYVHVPVADNIQEAKDYCKKLGKGWVLADKRQSFQYGGDPFIYYGHWLDKQINFSEPSLPHFADMFGWYDHNDGTNDIIRVYMRSYRPMYGSYTLEGIGHSMPLSSAALPTTTKKHPICILDQNKYAPFSASAGISGRNILIIDPSGKPYDTSEASFGVSLKEGNPVDGKWNYSVDIKTSVQDMNTNNKHTIEQVTKTAPPTYNRFYSFNWGHDIYKPEYWSSDNWAGESFGRGINVTLEASNAKCNTETATIDGNPYTYNVKRMQAYRTTIKWDGVSRNKQFYWEMDRNGQASNKMFPEQALGASIPDPFNGYSYITQTTTLDGKLRCEEKYGAGWRAPSRSEILLFHDELKTAGVMQPGVVYYTRSQLHDYYSRWEGGYFTAKWVYYNRFFIAAYSANSNVENVQKRSVEQGHWAYVPGCHYSANLLCVYPIRE